VIGQRKNSPRKGWISSYLFTVRANKFAWCMENGLKGVKTLGHLLIVAAKTPNRAIFVESISYTSGKLNVSCRLRPSPHIGTEVWCHIYIKPYYVNRRCASNSSYLVYAQEFVISCMRCTRKVATHDEKSRFSTSPVSYRNVRVSMRRLKRGL
jgi:hypothetical protein